MRKIVIRNAAGNVIRRLVVRVSSDGHREYREETGRYALAFFEHGRWYARFNAGWTGSTVEDRKLTERHEFPSEFKAFRHLIPQT